jgi:hypothetical protein
VGQGSGQRAMLVPGQIHRIRIEIAGSSFPLADRNWHAGDPNDLATDGPDLSAYCHRWWTSRRTSAGPGVYQIGPSGSPVRVNGEGGAQ